MSHTVCFVWRSRAAVVCLFAAWCAASADAAVQVQTLTGKTVAGDLAGITAAEVAVRTAQGETKLPLEDVLSVVWTNQSPAAADTTTMATTSTMVNDSPSTSAPKIAAMTGAKLVMIAYRRGVMRRRMYVSRL